MQAVARHGVRNDSTHRKSIVIGSLKKVLIGMRIRNKACPVISERLAEVGPLITGQPERVRSHFGIGTTNHFKLQIGNEAVERHRWMIEKVSRTIAADLFATKQSEDDSSLWFLPLRQHFG